MAAHTHSRVEVEEQLSGGIGRALVDGVTDLGVFADNMPAHGLTTRLFQIDELVLLCAGMRVRPQAQHPRATQTHTRWCRNDHRRPKAKSIGE